MSTTSFPNSLDSTPHHFLSSQTLVTFSALHRNRMGGCSKDVSYLDRRFSKKVRDNVHGNIYLDPLTLKFVDTEQFQRQAQV
ncbi:hypothetical protein NC652_021983 [Populus alba x Populus x berolinensis]|uniref:Uncharacterized protein n=1 Tax=Populus alba x Populus x berolinensis TaxID=444605 RepID=A0AAD6MNP4_9ROSI|nr:hypothetical protein NC652_021983 [Populus alba x Populus x berolinensis]KAJ6988948.1 hypothetical protein NC653_021754 [Populus alba x Populus x berolinensis]